jgi:anthranilate phosphoribosyltransferase
MPALRWNVAAYLWFAGHFERLEEALERATGLLLARSGERLRRQLLNR